MSGAQYLKTFRSQIATYNIVANKETPVNRDNTNAPITVACTCSTVYTVHRHFPCINP